MDIKLCLYCTCTVVSRQKMKKLKGTKQNTVSMQSLQKTEFVEPKN